MASLRPSPVDATDAHELLEEYFHTREIGFAHQGVDYAIHFPDPAAFVPPGGVFLVLDDGDVPSGCGGIRRLADGPSGIRYEVKHLYVREAGRGQGWGRLLLEALEAHAREWGAAELVLDTHHSLEAAAGLYRATGFTPVARYNDNPNATRWYAKTL
ncbi:PadR family transcriptional regulator [Microbacterium mangrovi]|uniref:PadR family transcriptional regulator n=1 Tax=Microbacterium mangrovi TaxID=1348253 RepID=A0A0B1ZY73_9MICO|nr:GNAT family N-acetyltransferase [Microbacterium mangrovi]KHK96180.1 PadR family transcriptional regulator [Microbacterium mangrovi]